MDWSVLPCAEASAGGSIGLGGTATAANLRALGDGTHDLRATATDAAGNVSVSSPLSVQVDTTAPLAQDLAGGGLSSAQSRSLTWTVPAGGSPIVGARVKLCEGASPSALACAWHDISAAGPFALDFAEPISAANLQLELTDAAGNTATTAAVDFSRDAVAPNAPTLTLVATDGAKRRFAIDTDDAGVTTELPRLCRNDVCQDLASRPIGNQVEITLPGAGTYRFETALRDAAGNTGPFASTSIVVAAPGPGQPPTTPPPATTPRRSTALTATFPKHLARTSLLIRGTVAARSTAKVTITLAGLDARSHRVATTRSVKPAASGRWSIRAKLPAGMRRAHGVLVTATATPNAGFAASTTRKRVRG